MSRLKIEHGVSRVKRVKLQTYIDQTIVDDIALMSQWTNNEQPYIINELLRFALTQSEEFQEYKTEQMAECSADVTIPKPELPISKTAIDPISSAATSPSETPAKFSAPSTKVDGHA